MHLCKALNSLFKPAKSLAVVVTVGRSSDHNHATPLPLKSLRLAINLLNKISPVLAGKWLERLWFSAPRYKEPQRETKWREQAQQSLLISESGELAVYVWGQQGPRILLVHGWSGRGTQMAAFAEPLQQAGYQVIAFDAPAHGNSPGKSSNIFKFIDAIRTLEQKYGSFSSVIAHSFGSMAVARALRDGLKADRIVCISPPARLEFLIDIFCHHLQAPPAARKNLIQRMEQRFGANVYDTISTECNARSLAIPVLIIHDEDDREVPVQQGRILADAWPKAQLHITHGLGHRRILRDQKTIKRIVSYIQANETEYPQ